MSEKTYIGADHGGFELKEHVRKYLISREYELFDCGAYKNDPNDDYPDYAAAVCRHVLSEPGSRGILFCGGIGQGMAICANKFPGIRATLAFDEASAKRAKEHGDSNVLCLGGDLDDPEAEKIVEAWLKTPFNPSENNVRRLKKIADIEGSAHAGCT